MRYVEAAGVRVSAIGLGTWQFGSGDWGYGLEYARTVAPAILRRALELGVTLIDTAETYGSGASELIVGSALRDAPRDPFVATKFTPWLPIRSVMVDHAERSRRRLQVAAIDLYQLHFPNPFVPLSEQAAGLRRVLDLGIARHVGVSSYSVGRWQAIERALGRPVLSNQVEFSLARSGPARDHVPYAVLHDRLVIAFSPLGQGLLAGDHPRRMNTARWIRRLLGSAQARHVAAVREAVREIAAAHDATMAQVALVWLIGHPNVVAIPGARTIEQLESNVRAADLELTADERARLSAAADELTDRRGR
jgi:aryl-alcohol dehydrogenase-like predicted oxidoreductase